jgi:hypothetical protein
VRWNLLRHFVVGVRLEYDEAAQRGTSRDDSESEHVHDTKGGSMHSHHDSHGHVGENMDIRCTDNTHSLDQCVNGCMQAKDTPSLGTVDEDSTHVDQSRHVESSGVHVPAADKCGGTVTVVILIDLLEMGSAQANACHSNVDIRGMLSYVCACV